MNANKTGQCVFIRGSLIAFLVVLELTTKETKKTKGLWNSAADIRKTIRRIRAIRWSLLFPCEARDVLQIHVYGRLFAVKNRLVDVGCVIHSASMAGNLRTISPQVAVFGWLSVWDVFFCEWPQRCQAYNVLLARSGAWGRVLSVTHKSQGVPDCGKTRDGNQQTPRFSSILNSEPQKLVEIPQETLCLNDRDE